jgi:hypothetical protein
MTPLEAKKCGESEFDVFEAKKRFPDSGKACVLKRKVEKLFASIHRADGVPVQYVCYDLSSTNIFAPMIPNDPSPPPPDEEELIMDLSSHSKSHFCYFSLQYIGFSWIREALFCFKNFKFGFSACFYP